MSNIVRNTPTASLRRLDIKIYEDGALALAPRETDFMAVSGVYVCGETSPHFVLAAGTLTNKRKEFSFSAFTITADAGTDLLTRVAHGLEVGDGPIRFTNSGGGLPGGIAALTDYWVIEGPDADTFQLAATLEDAYAGTPIDITSAGTGTNTCSAGADCERGLDGWFTYELTQDESDFEGSEFAVLIDCNSFAHANNGGGYATATMIGDAEGFDAIAEGAHSYGDLVRLIVGVLAGKVSNFTTGTLVFKSLDGTKNRLTVTTDATGRLTITVGDLS